MAQPEFRVVLTGKVLEDFDREKVISSAAKLFKCTEVQALKFVSGKPTRLKRLMDQPLAEKYLERLVVAGIGCRLEETARLKQQKSAAQIPTGPKPIELVKAPSEFDNRQAVKPKKPVPEPIQQYTNLEDTLHPDRAAVLAATPNVALSLEPIAAQKGQAQAESQLPAAAQAIKQGFHCPKCEKPQPKSEECIHCGIIFSKYGAQSSLIIEVEEGEDEPLGEWEEIELFVGSNIERYRHKFIAISENEGRYVPQWHWPAFLSPISWLIYRKLYLLAGISCVLMSLLPFIATSSIVIAAGLLANFYYYKHAKKSIATIASASDARRVEITERGGTHTILFTIGMSLLASMLMSVVMYFAVIKPMIDEIKPLVSKSILESVDEMENISKIDDPRVKTTKVNMLLLKSSLLIYKEVIQTNGKEFTVPGDMDDVVEVLGLQANADTDAWGTRLDFRYQEGNMIFISAGTDQIFDTADDIIVATAE